MTNSNKMTIAMVVVVISVVTMVSKCGDTRYYDARQWINQNSVDAGDEAIKNAIDSSVVLFGLTPNQKIDLYKIYYLNPNKILPAPVEDYD